MGTSYVYILKYPEKPGCAKMPKKTDDLFHHHPNPSIQCLALGPESSAYRISSGLTKFQESRFMMIFFLGKEWEEAHRIRLVLIDVLIDYLLMIYC